MKNRDFCVIKLFVAGNIIFVKCLNLLIYLLVIAFVASCVQEIDLLQSLKPEK